MGHSTEYEHLGADIPDTKIVTPRRIVMSGEPMDWERLVADALTTVEAHRPNPSRWQRAKARIAALRMSW